MKRKIKQKRLASRGQASRKQELRKQELREKALREQLQEVKTEVEKYTGPQYQFCHWLKYSQKILNCLRYSRALDSASLHMPNCNKKIWQRKTPREIQSFKDLVSHNASMLESFGLDVSFLYVTIDLYSQFTRDREIQLKKQEQERLEQERLEQERLEQERLEQERLEQERLEQERLANKRLANKRLANKRLGNKRLGNKRLAKERLEKEQSERAQIVQRAQRERAQKERERLEALHKTQSSSDRSRKDARQSQINAAEFQSWLKKRYMESNIRIYMNQTSNLSSYLLIDSYLRQSLWQVQTDSEIQIVIDLIANSSDIGLKTGCSVKKLIEVANLYRTFLEEKNKGHVNKATVVQSPSSVQKTSNQSGGIRRSDVNNNKTSSSGRHRSKHTKTFLSTVLKPRKSSHRQNYGNMPDWDFD